MFFFIADVHDEGDTTPEYQPPEIPDMDIKPMMKGKEDFRSVLSSFSDPDPDPDWKRIPGRPKLSPERAENEEISCLKSVLWGWKLLLGPERPLKGV